MMQPSTSYPPCNSFQRQLLRLPQHALLRRRHRLACTAKAPAAPPVYEPVIAQTVGFPYGSTFRSSDGREVDCSRVVELVEPFVLDERIRRIEQVRSSWGSCCAVRYRRDRLARATCMHPCCVHAYAYDLEGAMQKSLVHCKYTHSYHGGTGNALARTHAGSAGQALHRMASCPSHAHARALRPWHAACLHGAVGRLLLALSCSMGHAAWRHVQTANHAGSGARACMQHCRCHHAARPRQWRVAGSQPTDLFRPSNPGGCVISLECCGQAACMHACMHACMRGTRCPSHSAWPADTCI